MAARTAFDANLLHLHLHFTAFTPGVDHARRVLRDMSQWAANPALGLLLARAEDNARRCYVAILSNDGATVNDICRDFMEMEVLLADFRRDPTSLDRWSSLPRRRRSDEYKFNKLLNRVGTHWGVPPAMRHPMAAEYQAHSEGLHPTPEGRIPDHADRPTRIMLWAADSIEHLWRIVQHSIGLAFEQPQVLVPGDEPEGFVPWNVEAVAAASRTARLFVESAMQAGERLGIFFPREPYSPTEWPNGPFGLRKPERHEDPS